MDLVRAAFGRFFSKGGGAPPKPRPVEETSRANAYLNAVYRVLFWEDPVLSWAVLGAVHLLFWAVVYFQFKLYGIVFFTVLVCFLTDNYFERVNLVAARNPSSETIGELIEFSKRLIAYFRYLRSHNPPMFALVMCSIFGVLTYISKKVPGYFLAYANILMVFFFPLIVSKLPDKYKKGFSSTMVWITTNEGVVAEHELIPFISEKDLNVNDELESLLTDRTQDSLTNSLISGINAMPTPSAIMEGEGSIDGLEEDDLLPNVHPTAISEPFDSSDSDSDNKGLQFESSHFRDSSSEEEMNYAVGLEFPDGAPSESATWKLASGLLGNITSMGQTLVTNVLAQQLQQQQQEQQDERPRRKDSDSDFEFINSDDVDMN